MNANNGAGTRVDGRRVVNAVGQIRCNACGEYKSPEKMAVKRGRPETRCRVCKNRASRALPSNRKRRSSREYLEERRRRRYARWKALSALAERHAPEYQALWQKAYDAATDVEVLKFQHIREHERAVYADVPFDERLAS